MNSSDRKANVVHGCISVWAEILSGVTPQPLVPKVRLLVLKEINDKEFR
jgi:hypothetical protein